MLEDEKRANKPTAKYRNPAKGNIILILLTASPAGIITVNKITAKEPNPPKIQTGNNEESDETDINLDAAKDIKIIDIKNSANSNIVYVSMAKPLSKATTAFASTHTPKKSNTIAIVKKLIAEKRRSSLAARILHNSKQAMAKMMHAYFVLVKKFRNFPFLFLAIIII